MVSTINQARWIPTESRAVEHALGVVYLYERKGQFFAVGYRGKASKSAFHYRYANAERREACVAEWFQGLEAAAKCKAERRAERNRPHTLKVGDVLHYSWGYEQTNCDFFEVIATTLHSVTIREIGCTSVEGSEGFMSDRRLPTPGKFLEKAEPMRKRVGADNVVRMDHGVATKWDGKAEYCSWYA